MSNTNQLLDQPTTNKTQNVDPINPNFVEIELKQYQFFIRGLGTGSFCCNYQSSEQTGVLCVPLESLVWNGQELDLGKFSEKSACFDQGQLVGINLWGEGWEIIFNLGINVNGQKNGGEVTYQPIKKPNSSHRIASWI